MISTNVLNRSNSLFKDFFGVLGHNFSKSMMGHPLGKVSLALVGSLFFYKTFSFFRDLKASETRGHFSYKDYTNHHQGAIRVVQKCFDKIFKSNFVKINSYLHGLLTANSLSCNSDFKVDGSCFGNCCALGKEIIRRGKILSAKELQEIERGDKFPKRAMGFQLVQNIVSEFYKTYIEKGNPTSEEKDVFRTSLLIDHPDLIYPKTFEVKSIKTGYACDPMSFPINFPEVTTPGFSGFFLIGGRGKECHSLLLEIDNRTNTYVLYDNNSGFYAGKSREACLKKLKKTCLETYKFKTLLIQPYIL